MNSPGDMSYTSVVDDDATQLKKAYSLAQWKILPILFCLWMLAWVDRSNVAFAKLQMLSDLRFSETVYGVGAGLFFVGYVLFGVPTSLAQRRFGARRVLSTVAVCWGVTSIAMMFVHTVTQFYALRLLLGLFEAGFYPGVVLYFNAWFAGRRRARNFSIFHSGAVCSTVAVGLTGGFVLGNLNGLGGFEGWRWMFFAQAVPTVILALVAFRILPERPDTADWLSDRQKRLIADDLRNTPELVDDASAESGPVFLNSSVWVLSAMYFCLMSAATALVFFVPTILRESGLAGYRDIGFAVAGTSILGTVFNITLSTLGGEANRRRVFCALAAFVTAVSMLTSVFVWHSSQPATFLAIALGLGGAGAGITLFWQLSVGLLDRKTLIVAVPFISSIANIAGFITPAIIGYVRDVTGSYMSGFIMAACIQGTGVLFVLFGVQFIVRKRRGLHDARRPDRAANAL